MIRRAFCILIVFAALAPAGYAIVSVDEAEKEPYRALDKREKAARDSEWHAAQSQVQNATIEQAPAVTAPATAPVAAAEPAFIQKSQSWGTTLVVTVMGLAVAVLIWRALRTT